MTLSRNQREGHYDGYYGKHYRSRFHRLSHRHEQAYIALIHVVPDLSIAWAQACTGPGSFPTDAVAFDGALAIGELGTIDRFRFIATS